MSILSHPEGEDLDGKSVVGLLQRRPDCRKEAYELLASTSNATPASGQWLMPTSSVATLLARGVNDPDPEVSAFCSSTFRTFASAVIRPPCLTMEWSRRVPVVADRVNPSLAVQLAVDFGPAKKMPRLEKVESIQGEEEPVFVVDSPEVLDVSDAEEVMPPSPPKPPVNTSNKKQKRKKGKKDQKTTPAREGDDTVEIVSEEEFLNAKKVPQAFVSDKKATTSVQKPTSVEKTTEINTSSPSSAAQRQKLNVSEIAEVC